MNIDRSDIKLKEKFNVIFTRILAFMLSIVFILPSPVYASEAMFNGDSAGSGKVNEGGTWNGMTYRVDIGFQ